MSRLIDADVFIEMMEEKCDTTKFADVMVLTICKGALDKVPTVSQWIPCSERLPEAESMYKRPEHRYLCQREYHGIKQFFVGARLCDNTKLLIFWDWYGTKIRDNEVVAWCELPSPYKEDTK